MYLCILLRFETRGELHAKQTNSNHSLRKLADTPVPVIAGGSNFFDDVRA